MENSVYAGIIVYRIKDNCLEFLLLNDPYSSKKHWSPPKEKVAVQEDERKCAERDLFQTLGITSANLNFETDFSAEIKYLSKNKVAKRIVFFLAEVYQDARIIQGNQSGHEIEWFPLKQACEKVHYKLVQDALKRVYEKVDKARKIRMIYDRSNDDKGVDYTRDAEYNDYRKGNSRLHDTDSSKSPQRYLFQRHNQIHNSDGHDPADGDSARDRRYSNCYVKSMYKTKLCGRFQIDKVCRYGDACTFAHGSDELRSRASQDQDRTLWETPIIPRRTIMESEEARHIQKLDTSLPYTTRPDTLAIPIKHLMFPSQTTTVVEHLPVNVQSLSAQPYEISIIDDMPIAPVASKKVQVSDAGAFKDFPKNPEIYKARVKSQDSGEAPRQDKTLPIEEKLLQDFMKIIKEESVRPDVEFRELVRMEFKYNLSKTEIFSILFRSILSESYDKQGLADRVNVFMKFIHSDSDRETLLKVLEKSIPKTGALIKDTAYILKDMYDLDLIEEDQYMKWYPTCKDIAFKNSAAPFIEWLSNAEEED